MKNTQTDKHLRREPYTREELDRTIWRIAVPCVLENLLTFAATLIIAAMIGRLSADEISAQSIGNRITSILSALFKGIGVGATIIMGLRFGRGERAACRRIAEQTMLLVAAAALLLSAVALQYPDFSLPYLPAIRASLSWPSPMCALPSGWSPVLQYPGS